MGRGRDFAGSAEGFAAGSPPPPRVLARAGGGQWLPLFQGIPAVEVGTVSLMERWLHKVRLRRANADAKPGEPRI